MNGFNILLQLQSFSSRLEMVFLTCAGNVLLFGVFVQIKGGGDTPSSALCSARGALLGNDELIGEDVQQPLCKHGCS